MGSFPLRLYVARGFAIALAVAVAAVALQDFITPHSVHVVAGQDDQERPALGLKGVTVTNAPVPGQISIPTVFVPLEALSHLTFVGTTADPAHSGYRLVSVMLKLIGQTALTENQWVIRTALDRANPSDGFQIALPQTPKTRSVEAKPITYAYQATDSRLSSTAFYFAALVMRLFILSIGVLVLFRGRGAAAWDVYWISLCCAYVLVQNYAWMSLWGAELSLRVLLPAATFYLVIRIVFLLTRFPREDAAAIPKPFRAVAGVTMALFGITIISLDVVDLWTATSLEYEVVALVALVVFAGLSTFAIARMLPVFRSDPIDRRRYVIVVSSTIIAVVGMVGSDAVWIFIDHFIPDRSALSTSLLFLVIALPAGLSYALVSLNIASLGVVNRAAVISAVSAGLLVLLGLITKGAETLGSGPDAASPQSRSQQILLLLVSIGIGASLNRWSDRIMALPQRFLFPAWYRARETLFDTPRCMSYHSSLAETGRLIADNLHAFVEYPVGIYARIGDAAYELVSTRGTFTKALPDTFADPDIYERLRKTPAAGVRNASDGFGNVVLFGLPYAEDPIALVALESVDEIEEEYCSAIAAVAPDIAFRLALLVLRIQNAAIINSILAREDNDLREWLRSQRVLALAATPSFVSMRQVKPVGVI